MSETIKFVRAALDETESGDIILRGVVDAESLLLLKVGEYQREVLSRSKINELMKAVKERTIPDIDLGMRGGNYTERAGAVLLHDDVYIIDGLQRVTAAKELARSGDFTPMLGAIVHFNTTEESERKRFRMLNTTASRLSVNILLRNMRQEYTVIEMCYNLSLDTSFVLYDRISWGQNMQRHHLFTANTYTSTVARLHASFGPGKSGFMQERISAFQKTMNNVGRNTMRENTKKYFELVDECWHVRATAFRENAVYLRQSFQWVLASVIADHTNFWDGMKLTIDRSMRSKIALFPLNDPQIASLAGAAGKSRLLLNRLLVDHINSGKRTKRLVEFKGMRRAVQQVVIAEAS